MEKYGKGIEVEKKFKENIRKYEASESRIKKLIDEGKV
jgi:hypothetical protein